MEALVAKNASSSLINEVLGVAADNGETEIVTLLLDHHGANIEAKSAKNGQTPLGSAIAAACDEGCARKHFDTVFLLLQRGA